METVSAWWFLCPTVAALGIALGAAVSTRQRQVKGRDLRRKGTAIRALLGGSSRWDLAVSYAGADGRYVRPVVAFLRQSGLTVFDYQADYASVTVAGWSIDRFVEDIYKIHSGAVVVFLSKRYRSSQIAQRELLTALARSDDGYGHYVVPVNLDRESTRPKGIPICSIDAQDIAPEDIAAAILEATLEKLTIAGQQEDSSGFPHKTATLASDVTVCTQLRNPSDQRMHVAS